MDPRLLSRALQATYDRFYSRVSDETVWSADEIRQCTEGIFGAIGRGIRGTAKSVVRVAQKRQGILKEPEKPVHVHIVGSDQPYHPEMPASPHAAPTEPAHEPAHSPAPVVPASTAPSAAHAPKLAGPSAYNQQKAKDREFRATAMASAPRNNQATSTKAGIGKKSPTLNRKNTAGAQGLSQSALSQVG